MTESLKSPTPIRLRGRSFLAIVLSPELPFSNWLAGLDDLARRSTGFFLGRPIVLDVAGLDLSREALEGLIEELQARNVRIMGIEGARASLLGPGMPPEMRGGRPAGDIEPAEDQAPAEAAAKPPAAAPAAVAAASPASVPQVTTVVPPSPASLLIETPVRSGQSIVFPEGDVTVLGSVASGAEIIAGGSIHIYGALRGRVMAGSVGNPDARIFCRKLEAELLAIDGLYKMADDMDPQLRGQPVQVWLDGDAIKATTLN
ncbi:septum site-determining protein MinC [Aurantimonas sp. MSK8Z-1]|uniref:septum site-determining protein MinC n=1 Tax=Mangrovibrevibacter kandeliae TaxID=2968473 RepID=UPI002119B3D2|nr:septum site-determining protein MinC [Aurantimonas sp. MSK8Z-1]MCW4116114.1 septum site-determining protein MinC [Aurantimonas sp. MSK8Z-1]